MFGANGKTYVQKVAKLRTFLRNFICISYGYIGMVTKLTLFFETLWKYIDSNEILYKFV
jgi:hypothetical protein